MAPHLHRTTMYWTAAGVLIAAATLIVGVIALRPSPTSAGTQQTQDGHHGDGDTQINGTVNGDVYIRSDQFQDQTRGLPLDQARDKAKAYADVPPVAGQPAPFLVAGAPHSLWVRSSPAVNGHHIGATTNESTVWADCSLTTSFDPDTTDTIGPVWLRIHWPTDQPSDNLASSEPAGRFPGWVYAGYTVPSGHNGHIPLCR